MNSNVLLPPPKAPALQGFIWYESLTCIKGR